MKNRPTPTGARAVISRSHISPAYPLLQVDRVAQARSLDPGQIRALVEERTKGRILGFLGQERVNVPELNLDLEQPSTQ